MPMLAQRASARLGKTNSRVGRRLPAVMVYMSRYKPVVATMPDNDRHKGLKEETAMPAPTGDARRVDFHLLNAMRNEGEQVLKPELDTSYAKAAAEWVCRAIDYLLLQQRDDAAIASARAAAHR